MPTIDPIVSNYIDVAVASTVEKHRAIFNADMDVKLEKSRLMFLNEVRIEREIIRDDIRKIAELLQDRPTRTEVREMIDDGKGNHERRISRLEAKVF